MKKLILILLALSLLGNVLSAQAKSYAAMVAPEEEKPLHDYIQNVIAPIKQKWQKRRFHCEVAINIEVKILGDGQIKEAKVTAPGENSKITSKALGCCLNKHRITEAPPSLLRGPATIQVHFFRDNVTGAYVD
jgi:hypothetical protein